MLSSRRVVLPLLAAMAITAVAAAFAVSANAPSPPQKAGAAREAARAGARPTAPDPSVSSGSRPPAAPAPRPREGDPAPPGPESGDGHGDGDGGKNGKTPREPGPAGGAGPTAAAPAPEPPAEKAPQFSNAWAPPLSPEITYGEKCGEYNLCAYRRAGHEGRHDFRAPDSDTGNICYSFPPGDKGFVAVVNGRRYGIYVYEKPQCQGKKFLLKTHESYQDLDFAFTSYRKT